MKTTLLYAGLLITGLSFGQGFNININVNETGFNASVTDSSAGNTSTTSNTTTTSTTIDSTSSSTTITTIVDTGSIMVVEEPENEGGTVTAACTTSESELQRIKSTIDNESFGDDKMNVARQAMQDRCFTVNQVETLLKCFGFEDEKLALAKMAYEHTVDTENYYQLNSSFQFSDSKQALNNFINSQN